MSAIYHVFIDLGHIGYEVEADTEEQALDTAEQMLKDEPVARLIKNATLNAELIEREDGR
jgi:predicted acetyltransferase